MVICALLAGLSCAPAPAFAAKTKTHAAAHAKSAKKHAAAKSRAAPKRQQAEDASDQDLQKLQSLAKSGDPVGRKLVNWLYVTGTKLPVDARQLMAFVTANPGWPRLDDFRRKIEQNIAPGVGPEETVAWFDQNPPATADGARAYANALIRLGQHARARAALEAFWRDAALDKNETAAIAGAYKGYLTPADHAARLDRLIWDGRYDEAKYMLAFTDADARALAQARLGLARFSRDAPALVSAVPARLQNDESLLYERLRWYRRRDMDKEALQLIQAMPATVAHPEKWWGELNVMARRALEDHDYAAAYDIAKRHSLSQGMEYSQAEWLLGWLNLRRLNHPTEACRRFDNLYHHVSTAISRSRAAYWAARSAEQIPDASIAAQWDKVAATYPSTYYGQLSYRKVYGAPTADTFRDEAPSPDAQKAFDGNEIVRAARLLHNIGLDHLIDPFLARLNADAKTKLDYQLLARLARETGRYYYAVQANKEVQQKLGQFLFDDGYPVLSSLPLQSPEKALVHAIIHRESMFNAQAESPAGARGLMQLMPSTAKHIAKHEGETYNVARLTADPRYNVLLGSAYLRDLVDDYGGFYPMAIAAYNAGPSNVGKWVAEFGDPRDGKTDLVDWLESIPIYETRNYVQRVMESYYIYRLRFGEAPRTVLDFKPR